MWTHQYRMDCCSHLEEVADNWVDASVARLVDFWQDRRLGTMIKLVSG